MFYDIHDNGGRPFQVHISPDKTVQVAERIYTDNYDDPDTFKYIKTFNPTKVFVGKSPKNAMTKFSGGYGKEFDGNSILLKLRPLTYVYIGSEIYQFKARAEIVEYVSPVGNSDVPYPYARDSEGAAYLMLEQIVCLGYFSTHSAKNDPYDTYYHSGDQLVVERFASVKTIAHRNV